ncbi:hypothetical protein P872_00725 [Rhodonellum psychrophilum GCM71 = DSM 17998]|uniref:DUF3857 domain-containing protein n=3 Tax=Cytophagaceae TaxID=89373 RepID=U5BTV7_9BACT|nr:hypothetical protein P872_00725 [Rhodonellum psychrophilum GCM71 = DSM 17998]SDY40935.1 Transglutaminase-like superfamily protein [Rhodonellum ikkaensis]
MARFSIFLIVLELLFFTPIMAFQSETIPVYSKLEQKQTIQLNPDFSVTTKQFQSIHILEPKGLQHANINIYYDKFNKIENFEALLIDPVSGKTIRKIKLKDLSDASRVSGNTLYQDSRVKFFVMRAQKTPVILEVSLEVTNQGNFYFPDWRPVPHYNQKVTETSLEVIYPEDLGIRYKTHHLNSIPVFSGEGSTKSIKWEEKNLSPQKEGTEVDDPYLELAPIKFSMEGYGASMDSWAGLGSWMGLLNKNKDVLSPHFKSEVHALIQGVEDDPYEKISVLYQYLQKNYRYVSIQLGIGGWMSESADEVVKSKYGDCKALTMLMKAMLKEVGIPSQYTLVKAGKAVEKIDLDFPSNQFNHVILRVPQEDASKPLWLECTSNTLPAGYLGDFTRNRDVLVVTDAGGFMDKTPAYDDDNFNTIVSSYALDLKENGDATLSGLSKFYGAPAVDFIDVHYYYGDREKKIFLNARLGGNGLLVNDYQMDIGQLNDVAIAEVEFNGIVQRFSQNTSKRSIIPVTWKKIDEEMMVNNHLMLKESFLIRTPNGLKLDETTSSIEIEEEYFKFKVLVSEENGQVFVQKELEIHFPEEMSKESKKEAIDKINVQTNKSLIFKKSVSI